jgi:hypothetical protein
VSNHKEGTTRSPPNPRDHPPPKRRRENLGRTPQTPGSQRKTRETLRPRPSSPFTPFFEQQHHHCTQQQQQQQHQQPMDPAEFGSDFENVWVFFFFFFNFFFIFLFIGWDHKINTLSLFLSFFRSKGFGRGRIRQFG